MNKKWGYLGIWWERYMYYHPRKKAIKLQGWKRLYKKTVEPIWIWNWAWFWTMYMVRGKKERKIHLIFTQRTLVVDWYEVRDGVTLEPLEEEILWQHTMRECEKHGGWTSSVIGTCLHLSVILATFPSSVSWTLTRVSSSAARWSPVSVEACERGFLQAVNFALTGQSEPILMIRCHVLAGLSINCPNLEQRLLGWQQVYPNPWLLCHDMGVGWVWRRQVQLSSVQLLGRVWLFATPWTAACQASLSIPNSRSLLKLMSIVSTMPSSHLMLCHPLLLPPSILPSIRVFSNESVLWSGGQNVGVSTSASVLPVNIQDWFPLGWTSWISLKSKGLSRVFSNKTVQKHQFFDAQLSL